jgi:hypothetical protein
MNFKLLVTTIPAEQIGRGGLKFFYFRTLNFMDGEPHHVKQGF